MSESLVGKILVFFAVPPGLNVLLLILALWLFKYSQRFAFALVIISTLLLWFLSTPILVDTLDEKLVYNEPFHIQQAHDGQAIVVLHGGKLHQAVERDYQWDLSMSAMQRLRHAAYIHKKTNLPILVSGGNVFLEPVSGAKVMKDTLKQEWDIETKWIEDESLNTYENAVYSAKILKQDDIRNIILVTQASHLSRAMKMFSLQGLTVFPAPVGLKSSKQADNTIRDWLPSANALSHSSTLCYELAAKVWYFFRYPN